jgi:SAM-dependent methyltransferase
MPNPYPVLYRLGFTPWEGMVDAGPIPGLLATLPPGRALDAGCGTGKLAVLMAERGWTVTGVDSVLKPLAVARARARTAGAEDRVRFLKADVTRLDAALPAQKFDLLLDVGCLHGLTAAQQQAFATWATAHTDDGAQLVVLAVMPRRGIGPKGIDEGGITSLFGAPWAMVSVTDSTEAGGGPLKGAQFRWYHLSR